MEHPEPDPNPFDHLRRRAEDALRGQPVDLDGLQHEDIQFLLHELQVHQVELNLQNEELRRVQLELETSRDRYSDLYDFAPAGYWPTSSNIPGPAKSGCSWRKMNSWRSWRSGIMARGLSCRRIGSIWPAGGIWGCLGCGSGQKQSEDGWRFDPWSGMARPCGWLPRSRKRGLGRRYCQSENVR